MTYRNDGGEIEIGGVGREGLEGLLYFYYHNSDDRRPGKGARKEKMGGTGITDWPEPRMYRIKTTPQNAKGKLIDAIDANEVKMTRGKGELRRALSSWSLPLKEKGIVPRKLPAGRGISTHRQKWWAHPRSERRFWKEGCRMEKARRRVEGKGR